MLRAERLQKHARYAVAVIPGETNSQPKTIDDIPKQVIAAMSQTIVLPISGALGEPLIFSVFAFLWATFLWGLITSPRRRWWIVGAILATLGTSLLLWRINDALFMMLVLPFFPEILLAFLSLTETLQQSGVSQKLTMQLLVAATYAPLGGILIGLVTRTQWRYRIIAIVLLLIGLHFPLHTIAQLFIPGL